MSEIKRKKKIIGSRSVLDEELKYTLCPFLFILHIHQTRGEEEEEKRKKKKRTISFFDRLSFFVGA